MKKIVIILLLLAGCSNPTGEIVQMEKVGERAYQVDCIVNGLNLKFILDTRADQVTISLNEALFMLENGYLSESELLNTEYYRLANRVVSDDFTVILRTIKIGGLTIHNVEATIVHSIDAPLLFGQSALERLGKVTIDYSNNQLVLGDEKEVYATPKESAFYYFINGIDKYAIEDYRGAIQDYSKAIEINPSNSEAYLNRGLPKHKLGDYRGAIQDYSKSIEINPSISKGYFMRGFAKQYLEDYRGAIQDYDKAIEINPSNSDAYSNRGFAKKELGNYRGAIQDYSKVIEINPSNSEAYFMRGFAKQYLEDYRGAIQDYNKAIEINPSFIEAYNNRGVAKYRLGDLNGACLDWSKSGELGNIIAYDLIRDYCN